MQLNLTTDGDPYRLPQGIAIAKDWPPLGCCGLGRAGGGVRGGAIGFIIFEPLDLDLRPA